MARDIHLGRSLVKQKTSLVETVGQRRLPQAVVQSSQDKRSHYTLRLSLHAAATTLRIFCRPSVGVYKRGNSRSIGLDGKMPTAKSSLLLGWPVTGLLLQPRQRQSRAASSPFRIQFFSGTACNAICCDWLLEVKTRHVHLTVRP